MNPHQFNNSKREKIKIAKHFDRAAKSYTAAAILQQKVGDHLLQLFDEKSVRTKYILDLGAGNGLFSKQLALKFLNGDSENYLINLDIAHRMLKYNGHYKNYDRVNRVCADFDMLPYKDNSIDFIFSNMVLQWSLDIEKTLSELYRVLSDQGRLLFSIPILGSLYELHQSIQAIDPYRSINYFLEGDAIKDALSKVGFKIDFVQNQKVCLLYNDFSEMVRNLHDTGTNHIKFGKGNTLTGKRFFNQLAQAYQTYHLHNDQLPMTFNILYIKAHKRI